MSSEPTVEECPRPKMDEEHIEICDLCKSGLHPCNSYFCMCECRNPTPWRLGRTAVYDAIYDADDNMIEWLPVSGQKPNLIGQRIIDAINARAALTGDVNEIRT